jgi:hypothetical protein
LALIESEPTLAFCFDAFSSREPVSTSLENALCRKKRCNIAHSGLLFASKNGQNKPEINHCLAMVLGWTAANESHDIASPGQ